VYRLNVAESLTLERSKCPHCKEQINWYDNIPLISFVLLKFRCRNCKEKISWQYPIVELFTALVFALVGYFFFDINDAGSWAAAIYYLGVVSFLITIATYDFLFMEIPGLVLWPAIGWTIAFNLFFDFTALVPAADVLRIATYSGVLAAFTFFLVFFMMVAVSKEKWMGMGDAYLVILLGLLLGWPKILLALILAFSIGAIAGIFLILTKKKKLDSQIPFGPFLILGTLISLFFYESIVGWYVSLFHF
jgi:prepilin signal peptidase PulO-like enzyme (type II secretory pathway)